MKKNLLFLLGLGLLSNLHVKAQVTFTDLNLEAQQAEVSVVDWDNDGDLDILISGETGSGTTYAINMTAYLNDGSGNYTPTTVPFKPVSRGAFDWNDINQDGKVDFLENGFAFGTGAYAAIFNSNGAGTFTLSPVTLPQMAPSSGFADLNNDGYTDIYIFGNEAQMLGKSHIYFSDKMGGFIDSHILDNYTFNYDPDVTVVDFNNDKYLDLFITAGSAGTAGTRYSRILKNNGDGTFTEMSVTTTEKGYGSSVWGDYDGDGYLDLLLNGDGMPPEDTSNYKLYKNNGGTSFTQKARFDYRQGSTGDGGRFLDWDNDGDLDFVITGYTGVRQATDIYLNDGLGNFTAYANNATIPGVSESSLELGDVDNDGDLDIVETGFSGNDYNGTGSAFNKNVSILLKNPAVLKNTAPTAPSNLGVTGNSTQLTFGWSAGTDATTPAASLSYNMFLVDATGKWFYYPLADTATGKLKQQKMGNVNLNLGWIIKGLPAGTYRWGVQAIDNSFIGSPFATSSFTINVDGTLPVRLSSYTAIADGKKSRIEWVTASEQNNNRFEVERSSDGKSFYPLASVQGKGTTGNESHYLVYDNNPSKMNYYRLTQYNIDGRPTVYGIKTVSFNNDSKATVIAYPNPAETNIGIRLSNFTGKVLHVTMTDMVGKLVHTEVISAENGQGYYPLHFSSKPVSGQYMLSVSGEGLKETLKVILK